MSKKLDIIGKIAITISLLMGVYLAYQQYVNYNLEKKATYVIDRVAMTVIVDYLHMDKKNRVDLINNYTKERYENVIVSKVCPDYGDTVLNTPIDVIQLSHLNGITNETWKTYEGLYEKICFNKIIFNHEKNENLANEK